MSLTSYLFRKIGVDLGTSMIRVWDEKEGVVVRQSSCLALDRQSGRVLAVGDEALEMVGRAEDVAELVFPISRGRVSSQVHLRQMLTMLLKPVWQPQYLVNPIVAVSVPASSSKVDQSVVTEVVRSLGAKEVITVVSPLAAAIGSGVPIADASGSFFLQMGAGVVEATMISLGSLVDIESTTFAGGYLDRRIYDYFLTDLELMVGQQQLEKIKTNLISLNRDDEASLAVTGKDRDRRTAKRITVESNQLQPVISEVFARYEKIAMSLLERIPADLTADSLDKGLLLAGGMAEVRGVENYLSEHLNLPVAAVDKPKDAVVSGLGVVLQHLDEFKNSLGYQQS